MNIKKFENIDVRSKFVLLRDDFNVQIIDGKIMDAFRIEQSMPTIRKLQNAGAKIVICAHFGRPRGSRNMEFSLAPIAKYLNIPLIHDCLNHDFMTDMRDGDIALLENLRFYPGEEENDSQFACALARGFDIFINDAFAVSHRAHASTVGVAEILPAYAGDLLSFEIENLSKLMENPNRPLLSIVAGSKISTKLNVIKSLLKISDRLIVGGAIGTTFNYALGENVGNSLYEADMADTALEIIKMAAENNCELMIPLDKGVASEFKPDAIRANKSIHEIAPDDIILDAGTATIERDIREINNARTVLWNGTLGMAEWMPVWSLGSFAIARAIADATIAGNLISIVGGGDTVAALEQVGVKDDISYVSTGGGAFLEFIEGKVLPGIAVLEVK